MASDAGREPPRAPEYTMIVDMSAHLDWDWINTFLQYCKYALAGNSAVYDIFDSAVSLINNAGSPGAYPYSICEAGYLRQYIETGDATRLANFARAVPAIAISGGGVTSPDNLLCSGEGFIRTYLVTNAWLKRTYPALAAVNACWIPDDFGHDAELPVVLSALGFKGVGFARIPGVNNSGAPNTQVKDQLIQDGVDFVWQASDGSSVLAHWMVQVPRPDSPDAFNLGYGVGMMLQDNGVDAAVEAFADGFNLPGQSGPVYSGAPANLMYIAADNDFTLPMTDLLAYVAQWNGNKSPGYENITLAVGTFNDFIEQLAAASAALKTKRFAGTPVWTGIYGSKMELKLLHYRATRTLLAAEVYGMLAQRTGDLPATFWGDVEQAWSDFAPSSHHDYITGTGSDAVYSVEQLPLLRKAAAAAEAAKAPALYALLVNIPDLSNVGGQGSAKPLLIANALGFARSGLVAVPDICPLINSPASLELNAVQIGAVVSALQYSYEGDALFLATVPSFGYVTGQTLNVAAVPPVANAVTVTATADQISLSNGIVETTVAASGNWDVGFFGPPGGANLIAAGGTGNAIMVWDDAGNSYAFGNEPYGGAVGTFAPAAVSRVDVSGPGLGTTVLETGPLRGRAVTVVDYVLERGQTVRVTREYQLIAGEAMLRMITTLTAPPATSVMVRFPFAAAVDDIVHGTPCHWTDQQPWPMWGPPLFRPTHDFLLPRSNGAPIAAIYHNGVPGWASDAGGALLGCLARSTNNGYSQNLGTDNAAHTLSYALRLADAASPANGQPVMEARSFSTPLDGMVSPGMQWGVPNGNPSGALPQNDSLAQAAPAPAMLIAAKPAITAAGATDPSSLVLRLYQPTNQPLDVTVTLGSAWQQPGATTAVTALENPDDRTPVAATANGFTVGMSNALVTVKVAASAKA